MCAVHALISCIFFSSRRRHTRYWRDWSSDVCSSDLRYVERGLPFTAWLYRIAHNHLVDHLRSRPRYAANSLDSVAEVAERSAPSAFGRVLDQQALAPALARLTPEQRRAVELRFLEGLSVAETAEAMNRSDEAVKKLQARALN